MKLNKKYFQDHFVLLLLSVNAFLALGTIVLVVARLTAGHGSSYIVQYREPLGINAFKTGGVGELLSFVVFALMVFALQALLSHRTYAINRQVSVVILGLGSLLLLLGMIISNALLVLH